MFAEKNHVCLYHTYAATTIDITAPPQIAAKPIHPQAATNRNPGEAPVAWYRGRPIG